MGEPTATHAPEPAAKAVTPLVDPGPAPAGQRSTPFAGIVGAAGVASGAAALRPGDLAALQRLAGNRAVADFVAPPLPPVQRLPVVPVVQRDDAPAMGPKFTYESPELEIAKGGVWYFKGDVKAKLEVTAEAVSKAGKSPDVQPGGTSNAGVKFDVTLGKQKVHQELFLGLSIKEVKHKLSFELSKRRVDISYGAEAPIENGTYPWLKGVIEGKFTAAGVDFKKLTTNPEDLAGATTVFGAKGGGGISGEGIIHFDGDWDLKVKAKISITGTVKPDLAKIGGEVAKQAAKGLTEGVTEGVAAEATSAAAAAGEAVAMDTAAAALSAAGAIAVPLAAAAAIGAGMYQGAKNTKAAVDAANAGVATRAKLKEAAKGYASTLTGSAPKGDIGSQEAARQIADLITQTKCTHEEAVEGIKSAKGGYGALYQEAITKWRDAMYDEAVNTYETAHQADFGWLESLGPTWGMRGVYRKTLRIILYADD